MASFSGGGSYLGNNLSLFTGMQLFESQPQPSGMQQLQQQQQMSSLQQGQQTLQHVPNFGTGFVGWQHMNNSQLNLVQSQSLLEELGFSPSQGLAPSSLLGRLMPAEQNWVGRDGDATRNCERSIGGGPSDCGDPSKGEEDRQLEKKLKLRVGGNPEEKTRKAFRGVRIRDNEKGEDKSDGFRDNGEPSHTPRIDAKIRRKKHELSKRERGAVSDARLLENQNDEFLESSSDSGSSSDDSDKDEKEGWNKKRKRTGQDADGNTTWTDESVKFLFETYDVIHQRLWKESNGHVKYQKKWTPILKAMQDKFGKHFSKKQCQSKYWSVRRECADYRSMSAKAAQSDPCWNPSIAGRELLKPKFYDVWFEVSGKKEASTNLTSTKTNAVKDGKCSFRDTKTSMNNVSWKVGKDGQPTKHKVEDCSSALKKLQRLMQVQLQASEKREEAMKLRTEQMMDLLTQHMEHVERRVNSFDEGRQPQLYLLERVNYKLEKVLEGFTALNENLSVVAIKSNQKPSSLG